ncbi:MAG: type II secretion system protein M [Desulfuromonadales bacterium]|nr:type II secretion system protein M [Desulfuromonadales bacterium]MBN2790990.1 type II secretion system protein M [Desulfuromonadales bacterium]
MLKRLNPRERVVVFSGLFVVALLFIWFVLVSPYFTTMSKLDRRLVSLERQLVTVQSMRDQILQLRQQLATAGPQTRGRKPLFSQVESLTEQTGLKQQLLSMRPQPATVQGEFRQQLVEIRLEKMALAQLVKLLHAIEYRSGGIQVKSLRIKPRFEDRSALDVNMVLMSLEMP